MKNQKDDCKKLFKRWKQLKKETKIEVVDIPKPTGEIPGKYISQKKQDEKNKTKEELNEKCKDFLLPEELEELERN